MHENSSSASSFSPPGANYPSLIGCVARTLLGEPNRRLSSRRELRFGRKGSISVRLDRGTWFDHEAGTGGGVVDLVRREVGDAPGAVRDWLSRFGVAADACQSRPQRRPEPKPAKPEPSAEEERDRDRARQIWREAFPALNHTPAEAYLRRRGIWEPARDAFLRFARLRHPETRETLDAIVVPRVGPDSRRVDGVQRIFLTPDGRKYGAGPAKMSLGRIPGGRAPLFRPAPVMALAEGVESALAAAILLGVPAWACCGGFPAELQLPPIVQRLTICADHDAAGTSLERAIALAEWLSDRGLHASVRMGAKAGSDANDLLLSGGWPEKVWPGLHGGVAGISDTMRLDPVPSRASEAWSREYATRGETFHQFSSGKGHVDVSAYPFASEYDDDAFI